MISGDGLENMGAEPVPEETEVPVTQLQEASQRNNTLLDNLKQKRERAGKREVLLPIPGYDDDPPMMLAKYRLLEGKEIDNIANKVQRETKSPWDRNVLAAVDVFIASCEGMYFSWDDGQDPLPMMIGEGESARQILGYNEDLAKALEFESTTARGVVYGVFANNEIAIMQHNVRLSMWMSNTSRKVDDDFLVNR